MLASLLTLALLPAQAAPPVPPVATSGSLVGRTSARPTSEPLVATAAPGHVLRVKEVKHVRAVLTYDISHPNLQAKEWIVCTAVAPELTGQTRVKTTWNLTGQTVQDRSPLTRALLLGRVPASTAELKKTLKLRVTCEAVLRSRFLEELPPGEKAPPVQELARRDRQLYLASYGDADWDTPAFKVWLREQKLERQSDERDLEFARRSFLALRAKSKYRCPVPGDRRATSTCKHLTSDCGGLSSLHVAVLRAGGVPARALFGRWAMSTEKIDGELYHQWHVKSEFFASGVGWVPADLSSGLKDTSPAGLLCFGRDEGDFLTLHLDSDLVFQTGAFGVKTLQSLQTPAYWVSGGGALEPSKFVESWSVEEIRGR